MPVYTYHCDACGKEFEVTQRMSDEPLTECPCGEKGHVRRLISAGAGVIFKGSGFYETDYKRGGNGSQAPSKDSAKTSSSTEPACGSGACPACSDD